MPGYRQDILVDVETLILPHLLCCICQLLLRNAVQSRCGHRFCESCVQYILRSAEEPQARCPLCSSDSEEGILNEDQIYRDFHARKELKNLKTKCCNNGCQWKGVFQEYINHETLCKMETIKCRNPGCGKSVRRSDMPHHLEKDCPMRTTRCRNCGGEIPYKYMKKHPSECPKVKVPCSDCGKKIARDLLKDHQDYQSGDCPNKTQHCYYTKYGCDFKIFGPGMDEHIQSELSFHTQLQINHHQDMIIKWKKRVEFQEKRLGIHLDLSSAPPARSEDTLQGAACADQSDDAIDVDVSDPKIDYLVSIFKTLFVLKSEQSERESSKMSKSEEHRPFPKSAANQKMDNKIRDLLGKCNESSEELARYTTLYSVMGQRSDTFQEVATVLNNQSEQQLAKLNRLHEEYLGLKALVDQQQRQLNAQDQLLTVKSVTLTEQDLRLQSLEVPSLKGVLVWPIIDFSQKRRDAISGRTLSFYSQPFYTSFHGYKMCSRIYLNGDGMGKGTHVSLFFVVMKGEHDNILSWPFKQKVTFMLMDQGNREHVIDSFHPDPASSSFKKPTNDMNVASGCPLFANLNLLESDNYLYVKDDCIFIKVSVDVTGLERM